MTIQAQSDAPDVAITPVAIGLLLVPALHPLLLPVVGVASHLLWFVHVLPVALLVWERGRGWALPILITSGLLVLGGEAAFGAGYGTPAPWQTALSLALSVTFANVLVAGFAVYARAARDRYRLLFHRVRMGVLRVDPAGSILEANPRASEILGRPAADLDGAALHGVLRSPDLAPMEELARAGAWTGRVVIETDAAERALHVLLVTVPQPDGREYQVLLADRSLEILQARELERKSKLAALGEALAGVAHELNNPLTAILGHAELGVSTTAADDEARELFEVVRDQAERMRGLLRELLGFSRPAEEERATHIDELLRRLVRVQRMSLPTDVELALEVGCGGTVAVNPTKLEQVVLNLVSNAAYAAAENGGGTVEVVCGEVGDEVLVEVLDDGPGIDPEVLGSIFQPFVSTKPEGEGTGLGLAISRRLVRGWGGDLVAANREGGGARFVVRLPRSARPSGTAEEGVGDVSAAV